MQNIEGGLRLSSKLDPSAMSSDDEHLRDGAVVSRRRRFALQRALRLKLMHRWAVSARDATCAHHPRKRETLMAAKKKISKKAGKKRVGKKKSKVSKKKATKKAGKKKASKRRGKKKRAAASAKA